jgi:chromosome segregation ATPase
MTLTRYALLLLGALLLACQGCGSVSTEQPQPDKGQAKQSVFDLHAQLAQARDEVQREQERAAGLQAQIQSLTQKTTELQAELDKARTGRPKPEATKSQPTSTRSTDPGRIQLMGQKALAEYKADQLSHQLDDLSKDMDRKETELESIRQTAQAKEKEVALLRQQIDKLQAAEQSRTAELSARIDEATKQLEARSAEAKRLKQEVDEKTELLNALKNAVTDAGQLKSAAESENARLQTDLEDAKTKIESLTQLANQWKEEADRRGDETEKAAQESVQKGQEADQWRAEAERFRAMAEASAKDVQELKAKAEELIGRLQAMEGEAESEEPQGAAQAPQETGPSAVDHLLKGPKAQEGAAPQPNLY